MIRLPTLPRNSERGMMPMRDGKVLRAATGGARLPVSYLGDHWAIEIDTGTMGLSCARALVADLLRGSGETVRVPIPEPGVDKGAPGSPVIDGNDQAGVMVAMRGAEPYAVLRKGWFVTIEAAGGARAYMVAEEVVADADGKVTVEVWPMLHVPVADGDRVEVLDPWIEGLIDEGGAHSSGLFPAAELDSFVVEEES